MLWIPLAITAHLFWAIENIGDKFVVTKKINNPYLYLSVTTALGAIVFLLIPFVDFFAPKLDSLLVLILAGAVYFYGGFPYIKAMQTEEPTRVNVWWNLIPIFSLVLGYYIFGETFGAVQVISILILFTGAVLASIHFVKGGISFSKAALLMVVSGICFALYGILFRLATAEVPLAVAFIWVQIVQTLGVLTMFVWPKFRNDFRNLIKNIDARLGGMMVGNSLAARAGIFFNQWALSLGSAALVFAMEGFQVIFVFIMALFLTKYFPAIIQEEADRKNVALKIAALILMATGVVVLNLGR